ncbi:PAS domain-containing protein [Candidatus Sumerlaeota bacterium]|nr:PAS domain-containing protein [Candidatus Sumerlaeota bacterium]
MDDKDFIKQAQQALVRSQMELVEIIDSAADAILTYDQDGSIILYNTEAEKVFRSPASNMLGENISKLFPDLPWSEAMAQEGALQRWKGLVTAQLGDGASEELCVSVSRTEVEERTLFTLVVRCCGDNCLRAPH